MNPQAIADLLQNTLEYEVQHSMNTTRYRTPLMAWVRADDPRFADLKNIVNPDHLLPQDLLPEAKTVVTFFLPFTETMVRENARHKRNVAESWALGYVETNELLEHITQTMIAVLAEQGIKAAAQPPTHNFDHVTLRSPWSHKSMAVISGLGSFGLHHIVITDAGSAGRLGSLVLDADLPERDTTNRVRCSYFLNGSCRACSYRCPTSALAPDGSLDKQRCWTRCQEVAVQYEYLGSAEVCGKCLAAVPCAFEAPV